jgi:hypothetical protein
LDVIALPLLIKYRFGSNKNKPKTAKEKSVLILPIHVLALRAIIFNVGFTIISIEYQYDMTTALSLFVSGLVQLVLIYGWRNSFLTNCIRDDEEYSPEEQVVA